MKLLSGTAIILAISTVCGKVAAADRKDNIPVAVNVDCEGVNEEKLTNLGDVLLHKMVQKSYNSIYQDEDMELQELTEGRLSGVVVNASRGITYNDGWHCRYCWDDDDSAGLVSRMLQGTKKEAWEAELVAEMLNSDYWAFKDVKTCSITVTDVAEDEDNAATKAVADTPASVLKDDIPVAVNVDCNGVDDDKLSLRGEMLLNKMLRQSYNSIYQDEDMELKALPEGHLSGLVVKASRGITYNDGWHCRYCWDDDDSAGTVSRMLQGTKKEAWEAELVNEMISSGYKAFKDTTTCMITVKDASACNIRGGCN